MDFGEADIAAESVEKIVECPICNGKFSSSQIEAHVNACLGGVLGGDAGAGSESTTAPEMKQRAPELVGDLKDWAKHQDRKLGRILEDLSSIKPVELQVR